MAPSPLARQVAADPVHWLAFAFGTGLLPVAPGTFASLFTAVAFWLVSPVPLLPLLAVIVVLTVGGIWICGESSRRLGVHDHGGIVLDEVIGMLLTLTVVGDHRRWIIFAFFAFRVFDVWKPWPVSFADRRVTGGLGIVLDDVLAAAYAAAMVWVAQSGWSVLVQ